MFYGGWGFLFETSGLRFQWDRVKINIDTA